jgi:hypothetical protein
MIVEHIALIAIGIILQTAALLLGWFAGRSQMKIKDESPVKSPSYWHGVRKYD